MVQRVNWSNRSMRNRHIICPTSHHDELSLYLIDWYGWWWKVKHCRQTVFPGIFEKQSINLISSFSITSPLPTWQLYFFLVHRSTHCFYSPTSLPDALIMQNIYIAETFYFVLLWNINQVCPKSFSTISTKRK